MFFKTYDFEESYLGHEIRSIDYSKNDPTKIYITCTNCNVNTFNSVDQAKEYLDYHEEYPD